MPTPTPTTPTDAAGHQLRTTVYQPVSNRQLRTESRQGSGKSPGDCQEQSGLRLPPEARKGHPVCLRRHQARQRAILHIAAMGTCRFHERQA